MADIWDNAAAELGIAPKDSVRNLPPVGSIWDEAEMELEAQPTTPPLSMAQSLGQRTMGGTAGDIGVSLAKGIIGTGEAAVGLADIPTLGLAGKLLEKVGYDPKKAKQVLDVAYSPEQQAANKAVQEAKGFMGTTQALLENPSVIGSQVLESAPSMIAGGGIARGLIKGGLTAGKGLVAAGIGEGAVSAGQSAEQIRQDTGGLKLPQALASVASGIGTGAIALAGGKLAMKMGFADPDLLLAGIGSNKGQGGVVRRIIEGGISEGLFEEMPQSAQEQIWQNAAMDKPLLEGVPEGAVQGAFAGAVMGAGANILPSGLADRKKAKEDREKELKAKADEAQKALLTQKVGQALATPPEERAGIVQELVRTMTEPTTEPPASGAETPEPIAPPTEPFGPTRYSVPVPQIQKGEGIPIKYRSSPYEEGYGLTGEELPPYLSVRKRREAETADERARAAFERDRETYGLIGEEPAPPVQLEDRPWRTIPTTEPTETVQPEPAQEAVGAVAGEVASQPAQEEEKKQVHDYSNTQVNLPEPEAEPLRQFGKQIPEDELYTDPKDPSYGREENPHITVKYGLHTANPEEIKPLLEGVGPIRAKLGKVSIFESDDYDVVKVDIESPELHALNKKIAKGTKVTDTHPEYKPHATIAYVKKGQGKKYVGDKTFEGKEVIFNELTFSGKDGKEAVIPLASSPQAPKGEKEEVKTTAPAKKAEDMGRVVSSASRFRPSEMVQFEKPLIGPSGASLLSYQWQWQPEEYVDKLGEERVKRVSNWDEAIDSADTGRGIVHQFTVKMPDGTPKTVSAESVLALLGYTEKQASRKSFPSLANAVKTMAKLQMQLAVAKEAEANQQRIFDEVKEIPYPPIELDGLSKSGGSRIWRMGDATVWDHKLEGPISDERRKTLEDAWASKRASEKGIQKYSVPVKSWEYQRQIDQQAAKIEKIRAKMAEEALPPRTPDTMSEAIALSSPSGKVSKRAREEANERLRENLFGKEGLQKPTAQQPTEVESLRRQAKELRDLADRGMKPIAYRKEADALDKRADELEGKPPQQAPAKEGGEVNTTLVGEAKSGTPGNLLIRTKDGKVFEGAHAETPLHPLLAEAAGVSLDDVVDTGLVDKDGSFLWRGHAKSMKRQVTKQKEAIQKQLAKEKKREAKKSFSEGMDAEQRDGYTLREIKAGQLWSITVTDERLKDGVAYIIGELEEGVPGKRLRVPTGAPGEFEWIGVPSTYPAWFKNQGWTAKEAINAFRKMLDGKPLGVRQTSIVEAGLDGFKEMAAEFDKGFTPLDKPIEDAVDSELEDRHGTSDLDELERQGLVADEDKARAKEEAARDIAAEQTLSPEAEEALLKKAEEEAPWLFESTEEKPPEVKEQGRLFGKSTQEPFSLEPSPSTPQEKVALRASLEGRKAPLPESKGSKPRPEIPQEKIQPGTSGKQKSLFGPQKGETLDIFEQGVDNVAEEGVQYAYVSANPKSQLSIFDFKPTKRQEKGGVSPSVFVRVDTTGSVRWSGTVVQNEGDVASLLASLRKAPQENFYTVVTDKNGTILEVHRYAKGTKSGASLYPTEFIGRALNVHGAKTLYSVHNHPAADPGLSTEDQKLANDIKTMAKASGLESKFLVIGKSEYAYLTPDKAYANEMRVDTQSIKPARRKVTIPTVERKTLVRTGLWYSRPEVIKNSAGAQQAVRDMANNEDGVLLMDRKNRPIAFVPFIMGRSMADTTKDLLAMAERTNASGMAIKDDVNSPNRQRYINHLFAMEGVSGLTILDVINNGRSSADEGVIQGRRAAAGRLDREDTERVLGGDQSLEIRSQDDLRPQEKRAFNRFLDKFKSVPGLKRQLERLKGTSWERVATDSALTRQALLDTLAGKKIDYESSWTAPQARNLLEAARDEGVEGLWKYFQRMNTGFIGHPSKPKNSIAGSCLNCRPSDLCAKVCYAAGGRSYAIVIARAEAITYLIETDPARAAKIAGAQYKAMPEFQADKALRMFDRGEGSAPFLKFIYELNKQGVRTQVFSKRPEFLRKVSDFNLRLLSIDKTNTAISNANPDLKVAYVFTGVEDLPIIEQLKDRIQVILPVIGNGNEAAKGDIERLPDWADKKLCPVDSGTKRISEGWTCTRCDAGSGHPGCFYGSSTKGILNELEKPLTEQRISDRIATLRNLSKEIPDAYREQFNKELDLLGAEIRAGIDRGSDAYFGEGPSQPSGKTTSRKARPDEEAVGKSPQLSLSTGTPSGLNTRVVDQALNPVRQHLQNAPTLVVVKDFDALPAEVKEGRLISKLSKDEKGNIRGVHNISDNGDVAIYLVANNFNSVREVITTTIHETVGHQGVREAVGSGLDSFFNDLYSAKKSDPLMRVILEVYPFDVNTEYGRQKAADEWFARTVVEKGYKDPVIRQWWNRFVRAFREWARKAGFRVTLSDAEISDVMNRAWAQMEGGRGKAAGGGGQALETKQVPSDRDGNELVDMDGVPMETNPDGTVTLYHRTTKEKADIVKRTGVFKSLENTDETFFSNKLEGQAEGYGDAVIAVKVRPSATRINDAFHGGEIHVAVSNKLLSKRNIVLDKSQSLSLRPGDTTTPEFKEWFGKSAASDRTGKPVQLYHGTQEEIEEFLSTEDKAMSPSLWLSDLGIWLSESPNVGSHFAERGADLSRGDVPSVLPLYASIQRPVEFDAYEDLEEAFADSGFASVQEWVADLREQGYDGILIDRSTTDIMETRRDFVAFSPKQIKSVFNKGSWSTNPDISLDMGEVRPREYPRAKDVVDGRTVREHVPNTDSISASLTDYTILPGIREVPMEDFGLTGKHYSVKGNERIAQLAKQIEASKEINPLIVVIDKEGPYILEGATRAEALKILNAKSFPAMVVIDDESVNQSPTSPDTSLDIGEAEAGNPFGAGRIATSVDKARETLRPFFNDFMYWIVDKNRPIKSVQDTLDTVPEKMDLFLSETQRPKVTAARIKAAWDDRIKPILQKMAEYKITIPDAEEYAHAVHVVKDKANEVLRQANAKRYVESIMDAVPADESAEFREGLKDDLYPEEFYAKLEEAWERFGDNEAVAKIREAWDRFAEKPAGMTDEEAREILKANEGNAEIEEIRKMLLAINNDRLDILRDSGVLPEEEYDAYKAKYKHYVPLHREGFDDKARGTGRGLQPAGRAIKTRMGSTRQVVNIFANTVSNYENAINRAEKAASARAFLDLVRANPDPELWTVKEVKKSPKHDNAGNIQLYPNIFDVSPNEMRVMVDGKQYLIGVNQGNRDAMLMLRTLKAEDSMGGPLMSGLSKLNRWLSRINTSWSPEFIISNVARDLQTAGINIQDTGVDSKRIFRGAAESIRAIYGVERGKRKGTDLETLYDRFKAAGGKIGWKDVHGSVGKLANKITRELQMLSGERPVLKTASEWIKWVEDANTSIENGVRLHVFRLAVEQGMSDKRAAQIASDLTVDFTKKGAAGPVINSLYLFANAGIQGSYRIMRAGAKSAKVRKIMGGIVGAGFLVGFLNAALGGEDDDGEDYYNKIDDYIRERNMIFMLPGTKGKYVKIPSPWGYNFFFNLGDEISKAFTKENYRPLGGAARMASVFVGAFNPIQAGTLLQTLSPTVTDPFAQVAENKNWFGGDLMPAENKFARTPTPDSQRYWKSVSTPSRWVASQLNYLTGGSKVRSGAIDVSPETLDLAMDTIGGSALRFAKDTLGMPFTLMGKEEVQFQKVPFLRRVAGEKSEWADSKLYRENVTEILTAREEVKAYRDTDYLTQLMKDLQPQLRLVPAAERYENQLRKMRKLRTSYEARGMKEQVKAIDRQINEAYRAFNRIVNEAYSGQRKTVQPQQPQKAANE